VEIRFSVQLSNSVNGLQPIK